MLRICMNGKRKYHSIGIAVEPTHWDFKKNQPKRNCPNKEYINQIIRAKESELQKRILELQACGEEFTIDDIFEDGQQIKAKTVGEFYMALNANLNRATKLFHNGTWVFYTFTQGFHTIPIIRWYYPFGKLYFCTSNQSNMSKYLLITNSNEAVRVSPERIAYISSDGNYTTMVLVCKEEHVFTFNLATFEKLIEQQLGSDAQTFIRLGKSLIINIAYIYYLSLPKQQIVLSDHSFAHKFTLTASKEALKALKVVLEESTKNRRIGI